MENLSASCTTDYILFSISQRKNKSLQLTIALYYLPRVLSNLHDHKLYCQLRARKALMLVKDVPMRSKGQ